MKKVLSIITSLLIFATFLFLPTFDTTNGQTPPTIGIIDFYGLRDVSEPQVRQALQIKEGDTIPASREEAQHRLEALPNVQQAQLTYVCCDAGKLILYVGISEKGAPALQFRPAPRGSARLPDNMVRAGAALADAVTRSVLKGDVGEDDSQGHALYHNTEARALQELFIPFAAQNLRLLRAVLRESADRQHRALAAEIIAYAPDKQAVVKDLVYGMSDPDGEVRNNSMRALGVIARFAQHAPKRRIKVPTAPFVDLLNSIEWTDRNKASSALLQLTEKLDAAPITSLRQHALQSLVEMARWKSRGHASAPFFILGRVGNFSDEAIQKAWDNNREALIKTVLRGFSQSSGARNYLRLERRRAARAALPRQTSVIDSPTASSDQIALTVSNSRHTRLISSADAPSSAVTSARSLFHVRQAR
jgi:hypothetical protein